MALSDTRFANRRRNLAATLAGQRVDMMLVTHLTHVAYLSGFSGSNGSLILAKDLSAQVATDGRYVTQIAEEVPDLECVEARDTAVELLKQVTGSRRVGFEADYVSVAELEKLQSAVGEDITLVPVRGVIEKIRSVKDPQELDGLRAIADLANSALQELIDAGELAVGRKESDVAADLEYRMRRKGAQRPSFDTIVASGPNSAKPHHGASDRVIQAGDFVTIDFGAHAHGFNSDTTRTFIMGHATDFTREIYDVVLRAQQAGCAAAVAGTALADVDKACRDIITDAGYGEYFVHSTGHGVGLDLHEAPYAARGASGVLEENMTLTIEPGIYIPGKGGVRIEDTLIITSGQPENLTNSLSKEFQVIG
ncbi:aminopeptidase P family protein [Corynebacterium sp. sy017]|uniref:aminopeptidase P family protein n=1 Tax=unclassified Corynebacterium TaxID=2624378 RepID=UPI0011865723|nr:MULTISPECIES: Xaa-Pro peptidase family protein [unclassified Corynebacterium]MBP3087694.1 aminopeptidase P family protein [Corynebacterium sp. sy017]TSD92254.1 aminopeptidase P family protein [Corynebacterium sp. SY003]